MAGPTSFTSAATTVGQFSQTVNIETTFKPDLDCIIIRYLCYDSLEAGAFVYMGRITQRIAGLQWLCRMTTYNKILYEQQSGGSTVQGRDLIHRLARSHPRTREVGHRCRKNPYDRMDVVTPPPPTQTVVVQRPQSGKSIAVLNDNSTNTEF
jgi:hypothetical protein